MSKASDTVTVGRVASLHLHPAKARDPLTAVEVIHVVADKGIEENPRYFNRGSRRQVTLMEREQIAAHAAALGAAGFAAGEVRSNIETTGINLVALLGQHVAVGEAVLDFYEPRLPCQQMDALCPGLRERMGDSQQGVIARVVRSGVIRVGDAIRLAKPEAAL
jgi:MOSC domain